MMTTVLYSTPLILAALGGLFSERSGVVNIGLEGLMTIGAFTAAAVTITTGNAWIGLGAAIVAGMILALPHAIASITFKADQVVSGVAINFLALGLSVYLVKRLYDGAGQTPVVPDKLEKIMIPGLSKIPVIGPSLFNTFPTTYIAILLVIVSYIILYRTPFGMRLRAVGEHPQAAETAGVSVIAMRYVAVVISGALAAIGGAGLSISIGSEFNQTTVAGQGFIALAALIFGKWRPFGVLGAATFFGFSVALALTGQLINLTKYVPSEVLNMMPYVLTILALAGFVGRAEAPAAVGKPYEKGSR
ncbi:ABC transporter permease [Paenactinomyces guangxiensis]|uniref:ABC transporter permease n=1 Tax=Paenactinomyces guangxiensis TaxID=1490290 RepID=A0A7W1WR33_9BACL|nr:ABC transporter permease [Paenactinomyces guangxiensis]MBA4494398.1 ABC transporter permease [Paenactinomyces guangxiensis]MBH8591547.1 ABC transporter permease [Paenactinomyces guangxiensis]